MTTVTFLRVEDGRARVLLTTDEWAREVPIKPLEVGDEMDAAHTICTVAETPEEAAARWAKDAYGVNLTPRQPTLEEKIDAILAVTPAAMSRIDAAIGG